MRNEELLMRLTQTYGVSGHEQPVREIIEAEIRPLADEVMTDALGNLIAVCHGSSEGKRLMFAAHMDEIGLMVKKIEKSGLLRVCNVGWNWAASLYNARVRFMNGTVGVVGCMKEILESKNDIGELYIDIGAKDQTDAERMVHIGDVCGSYGPYLKMATDIVTAKTLDDRIGCFQLIEAMREKRNGRNECVYVFTVQEEVGCRGSRTAAARIQPDIGFAVDITPAHDTPCDLEGSNTVGQGIGIKYADPSVLCDGQVIDTMIACCTAGGIVWQPEVIDKGGTDASSMNLSGFGVRCSGISTVTRYPHSPGSAASLQDIEAGTRLISALKDAVFAF